MPVLAGYSGTPLPQKLGIKAGHRVYVGGAAPEGFLPDVERVRQLRAPIDVAVVFVTRERDIRPWITKMHRALAADGGLWFAWPKRASGVATDVTEDVVRDIAVGETTLVDNKVCAIDDVWSGLRLVVRVKDRPAWPVKAR
jgi:hypothetical protein